MLIEVRSVRYTAPISFSINKGIRNGWFFRSMGFVFPFSVFRSRRSRYNTAKCARRDCITRKIGNSEHESTTSRNNVMAALVLTNGPHEKTIVWSSSESCHQMCAPFRVESAENWEMPHEGCGASWLRRCSLSSVGKCCCVRKGRVLLLLFLDGWGFKVVTVWVE